MKICYVKQRFNDKNKRTIALANNILEEYAAQGFVLTLRQLYYKFVARDLFDDKWSQTKDGWKRDAGGTVNATPNYNYLKSVTGNARLAGLIDWEQIEDRTRSMKRLQQFAGPQDALDKLASWYHVDMWEHQKWRPEVWIEKDALAGVVQGVCQENDVPYLSCRGYTSLSEMWRGSVRLREWMRGGQQPFIIHFGDHDPSGIDMSRDICDRLQKTFLADCEFERVALTMDQVEEHQPPPNPAKVTDSRYKTYVAEYGEESWELDALEPSKFRELIEAALNPLRNQTQWDRDVAEKERVRGQLKEVGAEWNAIGENKRLLVLEKVRADESKKKLDELIPAYKKLQSEVRELRNGKKRRKR